MKVGIVGAGIAGIAAAIRLAAKGHNIVVYEANSYPGGKLTEINLGNYRFDAGPSLFTLPSLVDELFEICGEDSKAHFNYHQLDVNCHYFFPDKTLIKAYAQPEKFADEIAGKTTDDKSTVLKALNNSKQLYENLSDLFMFSSLQDPRTFISKKAFKAYTRLHRFGFSKTMHQANKTFFNDKRNIQLFNRYATYNGSSPYLTPATMNIIPHLEMSLGAYLPEGGMHAITMALYRLALRMGVVFHFDQKVERILTSQRKVMGLVVNGVNYEFDRVVCNMDIVNTYKKLLPEIKAPRFLLKQPKSSSALIFYWGIKKKFPELSLHNILFSNNYQAEFDHIFSKGDIYHDPTIYINITSKLQPKDAPEYGENWFTMINVPNNKGQDWDQLIPRAKEFIIRKISNQLDLDISKLIEVEEILEPRTIESKTSSALGALYGNSSNSLFAAFLRHANVSKRIRGLYLCGGSVHPGGGIPMCLSSAKLVAKYFR